MDDCIFCRIVAGEIPSDVVYRDEHVTAFRDIEPMAPVHILLIPNEHLTSTNDIEERHEPAMGRLLRAASQVAQREGIAEHGYRLAFNVLGDAGMTIWHLHLHVVGGRRLGPEG